MRILFSPNTMKNLIHSIQYITQKHIQRNRTVTSIATYGTGIRKHSYLEIRNRPKKDKIKNVLIRIKIAINPYTDWDNTTVPKPSQKTKTGTV